MSRTLILGVLCLAATLTQAATVQVNPSTTYQTIEGIGFFDNVKPWRVKNGPFYVEVDIDAWGLWDTIAYNLGASMIRFEMPPGFTHSDGVTRDMSAGDGMGHTGNSQVEHAQKYLARGIDRFIVTVWSPPGWMKASGESNGFGESTEQRDNYLLTQYYDEFADHMIAYADSFHARTGVELYGASPQNESRFSQPYNSCVYEPNQLRDLVKVIGPRWDAAGLSTRMYYAEHMGWAFGYYEDPVRQDAAALAAVDRWAYHGYTDGVTPDPGSFDGSTANEKAVWMTETCCYSSTIAQAENIHNTLGPGKGSVYMYWAFGELFSEGVGNFRWHALKQYARYIRPGAKLIGSSADGGLKVTAFTHAGDNTMTIAIINSGGPQSLSLSGSGMPANFDIYQCTNSSPSVHIGSMPSSGSINLPGSSVTTLYNTPTTGLREQAREKWTQYQDKLRTAQGSPAEVRIYSLDGRLVRAAMVNGTLGSIDWSSLSTGRSHAAGTYVGLVLDRDGNVLRQMNLSAVSAGR
ncbi:MAG: hypothetical protein GF331_20690 [Chitinivibrionales bacterium]|nr:hypothetical protein [Chitinivibrionales bacterium]